MKRLALLCPLVGALLVGLFDALLSFKVAAVELTKAETVQMVVYAIGRHLVVGAALALLFLVVTAASSRKRHLDLGILILAGAFAVFFLDATRDLFDGAKIAKNKNVGLYRAITNYGGPVGIFVGLWILRVLLAPFADPGRRRFFGRLLGLAGLAAALMLTRLNITWLPGRYPGVHALFAFGALLAATTGCFFVLRRAVLLGKIGAGRTGGIIVLILLVFGASILLHRREAFDRARASAGAFTQGAQPFARIVDPVFARFSRQRVFTAKDVTALMEAARKAGEIDYGEILDQMLPGRRNMNVLLVAMDTVRWDHTTLSGKAKNPTTPNLEALGRSSYVFEKAYTPYPTSNYAYNAILTGLSASATPLHGHRSKLGWEWPDEIYYPRLFAANGIHSNGVASFRQEDLRNQRFFGYVAKGFDVFNVDQTFDRPLVGDEVTASVRRQILKRPTARFFQFAHYLEPHDPYEKWPAFDFGDETENRYDSEIAYTDSELGKLLEFLKSQGLAENTIVAVFADHGESLGEHGLKTHDTSLFDCELHVPFVMHVPGLPGGRVAEAVSLIDMLPTVTRIIDLEDPIARMGKNLLPWMLEPGQHPEVPVFAEHVDVRQGDDDGFSRCIVHGGKKLIETVEYPQSSFRIYDLQADPGERRSLFDLPEIAEAQAELMGIMQAVVKATVAYHGDIRQADPTRAFSEELEGLLAGMRDPDLEKARSFANKMRDQLLSRYDALSDRCKRVKPELLESIRKEAFDQAMAALPKIRWELHEILNVLPHEDNAAFFRKMCEQGNPKVKQEGAVSLAMMGKDEALPILEAALQLVKDPPTLFPVVMALSHLGHHELVSAYAPILQGDSTWETSPLLLALTAAKDGVGLQTIYERLMLNTLHDFKLKSQALDYAKATQGPWSDLLLVRLTDEKDPEIRMPALAALEARLGKEGTAVRLERYRLEREGLDAQMNGKADLATERYETYVSRYPDAEARIYLGLARARMGLGDGPGVQAALREMESRGDADEKDAARRMLEHAADLKWFYLPGEGEWKARIELVDRPLWFVRNRSYFAKIRITNDSKVFWAGGPWIFGLALRTDILGKDGDLFRKLGDRPITRRVIPNYLPLRGLAPGESMDLVLVGHVPSGNWEDGRLAFGFYQNGNQNTPAESSWLLTLPEPLKPQ